MAETPRFEPRVRAKLPVTIRAGRRGFDGEAANISLHGMLVRLQSEPGATLAPRALVQVHVLTKRGAMLALPACVVHAREVRGTIVAGLRLVGLGGDDAQAWASVLDEARMDHPLGEDSQAPIAQHFEPLVYRDAYQVAVLRIYFPSVTPLEELADRAQRRDKLFVVTDEALGVGDEVGLQLCHPESDDIFELKAIVVRLVDQHNTRGIELDLYDLDDDRRARLADFIEDGMGALFDDPELE
ncbi:MAG: PilZ domain-containing protein [Polyangiaceae bacterium]